MGRGRTRYDAEGQLTLDLWGEESPAEEPVPQSVEGLEGEAADEQVRTTGDEPLATLGAEPMPQTPQQFADYINADVAKWTKLVRDSDVHLPGGK